MFDRNGDGCITKELGDSLHNLSIHIPDAEIQSMMDKSTKMATAASTCTSSTHCTKPSWKSRMEMVTRRRI
ncbi:Calmodulin-like protein 3 [Platanthera zijinensis]|uniref:Calmodulin-like protein 3 n=1 Tax=Platanthera zijinensis TaxID=2320716 RepID=A0AAP0GFP2_9ASPA